MSQRLPNVGAKKAQAIVAHRERIGGLKHVDDLFAIDNIGKKTVEDLLPFSTFGKHAVQNLEAD